jgi:hypothetical protein
VASLVEVYDSDAWTHVALDRGEVRDRFATMPEAQTSDVTSRTEARRRWAGNAGIVAELFGVHRLLAPRRHHLPGSVHIPRHRTRRAVSPAWPGAVAVRHLARLARGRCASQRPAPNHHRQRIGPGSPDLYNRPAGLHGAASYRKWNRVGFARLRTRAFTTAQGHRRMRRTQPSGTVRSEPHRGRPAHMTSGAEAPSVRAEWQNAGMPGRSKLTFVIQSETLHGEAIGRQLGLRPSDVAERGDPVSRRNPDGGRRRHTTWCLASGLADNAEPARHLESLLPLIEDRIPALRQIQGTGAEVSWLYFVTAKQTGNMFRFGPDLLSRLAAVGASLEFDIYDGDET